jgi:hypothetical protein
MPKVELIEIEDHVKDPLLSDNYEMIFQLPTQVGGNASTLRVQCKSAAKPGSTIEPQMVELFGHTTRHAGRKVFSGTMAITFQENSTADVTTILEEWQEFIRSTEGQVGAFKSDYAKNAELHLLDQTGNPVRSYKIVGVWPTEVPELTMDSAGTALDLSASFSFDHYKVI